LPDDLQVSLGRGAIISFSISTLDEKLASILEPGAPLPIQRLKTLQKAKAAGFLTGLNCLPLFPFISDTEEEIEKNDHCG
jgi:DNA repair photolyase